jgi:hypothetical protein
LMSKGILKRGRQNWPHQKSSLQEQIKCSQIVI